MLDLAATDKLQSETGIFISWLNILQIKRTRNKILLLNKLTNIKSYANSNQFKFMTYMWRVTPSI